MGLLRSIQRRTGGFTEFVPLRFIADEAPMARDRGGTMAARAAGSGGALDVLLTHAVARIMLGGAVRNIQASWVKEGRAMAQLLLAWGANDLGGTLINESISTSAGAGHGQLLRPREIRELARGAGRMPVERTTLYGRVGAGGMRDGAGGAAAAAEPPGAAGGEAGGSAPRSLDEVDDPSRFGSYFELIKIGRFRYRNARRQKPAAEAGAAAA